MTLVLAVRWVARAGEEATVAALLARLAPLSRSEPGCLRYEVYREGDDPRVFHLLEEYVDEIALEAHAASEHFQELVVAEALPLLDERVRTFLTPVA
jgi:quinol monooxygenase YgiN